MNEKKDIEYHTKMLEKCFQYGRKRIVYHENAHLLLAYFYGFRCKYVDYTIQHGVQYRNGNLEMEFNSQAHAYFDVPSILIYYYVHLKTGGTSESFAKANRIALSELTIAVKAHLTVLYSGYEAERHFFYGCRYWRLILYMRKYSQDLTQRNTQEDETKALDILTTLGFSESARKEIRKQSLKNIRLLFKEDKMKLLFSEFYQLSKTNTRLNQSQIEDLLSKHDFENWSKAMMRNLNN